MHLQEGIGGKSVLLLLGNAQLHYSLGIGHLLFFPWNACAIKSETVEGISKRKYDRNDARKLDDDTYLIVQTMLVETAEVFFLAHLAGLLALGRRGLPVKQRIRVVVRVQELTDITVRPVALPVARGSNASSF